jgi:hypothetical protein
MNKLRLPIRQGDVLFVPISSLPKGERKKRANGTVAYGEVTGHSHRLAEADMAVADVLEIGDGLFVHVSDKGLSLSGVQFVHEEHGPATLPPGNYEITIQREWSPEAIRNVVD